MSRLVEFQGGQAGFKGIQYGDRQPHSFAHVTQYLLCHQIFGAIVP